MKTFANLSIVLAFSAATVEARAEPPPQVRDPAAAEALFREGRARMEAGDLARACPKFAESLRLDFAAGTLLNLAACEEMTGKLAGAWEHFAQLLEVLPASDERRPLAAQHMNELDSRVPRLTVRLAAAPAGATVRVTRDDVELRTASLGVALPVDPGEHTVAVLAPGFATRLYRVRLTAGEKRMLAVAPGIPIDDAAQAASRARSAGFMVGGTGVVALGVGAYFGVRALSSRSASDAGCTNGACRDAASANAYDDARSFAHVADAAIGVGVVALGIGTYLVLTNPSKGGTTTKVAASASGWALRW